VAESGVRARAFQGSTLPGRISRAVVMADGSQEDDLLMVADLA